MKVGANGAPSCLRRAFAVEIRCPCLFIGNFPSEYTGMKGQIASAGRSVVSPRWITGRVSQTMESGSDLRLSREGEMLTRDAGFGGSVGGGFRPEANA